MEAMRDYGLREPEFCDLEIGFRINLYRKLENEQKEATQGSSQIIQNTTQGTTQVTQNTTQDTTQVELHIEKLSTEDKQVLEIVKQHPNMTQKEIAVELGWKVDRVKYYLSKMKRQNMIRRVGTSQKGHWELV